MINVNPPPQVRIPKEFAQNKELRVFFEQQQQILFQLWNRTGGNVDEVNNLVTRPVDSFSSQIQQLIKEADGLPEFTTDTTGFTTDTTFITTDKANS